MSYDLMVFEKQRLQIRRLNLYNGMKNKWDGRKTTIVIR